MRYPLNSNPKVLNLQTGIHESRIDHVSWHEKVINIKNTDNVRIQQYPHNLLEKIEIKLLFVESFYGFEVSHLASLSSEFKKPKNSIDQLIGKLDILQNFSLALFLVPKNFEFDNCYVACHGLKLDICFNQNFTYAGRIMGSFDDFDMLVCVMPDVSKLSNLDKSISLPLRKFCSDHPAAFLEQILVDNRNRFDMKESYNV